MILTWTWEEPFKNIRLFKDEELVGFINDVTQPTESYIFHKKIMIERQGFFKQHIYFVDPSDNKAYCQYNYKHFVSPHRTCEVNGQVLSELTTIGNLEKLKKMVELTPGKDWFGNLKKSGELQVFETDHISIDVFCLFYHLCQEADRHSM